MGILSIVVAHFFVYACPCRRKWPAAAHVVTFRSGCRLMVCLMVKIMPKRWFRARVIHFPL